MSLKRGRAAVLLPLLLCPAWGWAAAPTTLLPGAFASFGMGVDNAR